MICDDGRSYGQGGKRIHRSKSRALESIDEYDLRGRKDIWNEREREEEEGREREREEEEDRKGRL